MTQTPLHESTGGQIRLVVRADDMGMAHAANVAAIRTFHEGIVRSADVIVPGPWFPEAARLLNENPSLDAGVHLTLTSEWRMCRWRPLTAGKSLVDDDGYFWPCNGQWGKPGSGFLGNEPRIEDVERELRAQIELALKHIRNLTHISCHMGTPMCLPVLAVLTAQLAKEYGLIGERPLDHVHRINGLSHPQNLSPEQLERNFIATLDSLTPGNWMCTGCPGVPHPEICALMDDKHCASAQRANVTTVFTSQGVKDAVARRGIHLLGYAEMAR